MTAVARGADASFGDRAMTLLLALSIMSAFLLSSMMLSLLGIAYDTAGGAAWQKIHPASYFAALALGANFLLRPDPIGRLASLAAAYPGAVLFAVMWSALFLYATLIQHTPIAALVDTFLLPFAVLVLQEDLSLGARNFLRLFLHVFMFVNSTLGFIEFVAHVRLTPFVAAGMPVGDDYRSTAFLGHPLTNAAVTGAYILCLLLGGDSSLGALARAMLLVPQALAMAAFGGRTSIILTGIVVVLRSAWAFIGVLLGRRFDIRVAIAVLLGAPVVGLAAFVAINMGALDNLIARFTDDKGSAQARIIMLKLFDAFSLEDELFGPKPDQLMSTLEVLGIPIGIENTWLALMFQYGALIEACFIIGFVGLCWEIWRRSHSGATLLFAYFLAIVSSAIGLAAKTLLLGQFSILMLFVFSGEQTVFRGMRGKPQFRAVSDARKSRS